MMPARARLLSLLVTLLALVACTRGVEEVPGARSVTVSSYSMSCDPSAGFMVYANGFEPLYADALHGAAAVLPRLTVTRRQDLSSRPVEPLEVATFVTGAWDGYGYSGLSVGFTDPDVPTGFYEVAVASAVGGPPVAATELVRVGHSPVLTSLSPGVACMGAMVDLVVRGKHLHTTEFLTDGSSIFEAAGIDCVSGECEGLTASIINSGAPQTRQLSLANHDCGPTPTSTLPLVWLAKSIAYEANATRGCGVPGQVVTVKGANLYAVDGVGPVVTIGGHALPSHASGCVPISDPSLNVQACDTLEVDVADGSLPLTDLAVNVASPALPGCAAAHTAVALQAAVSGVTLSTVSAACTGEPRVKVTGSGLGPSTVAQVDGVSARIVSVDSTGTNAVIELPDATVGTKTLVLRSGGCEASAQVSVRQGPAVLGLDPPVLSAALGGAVTAWTSGLSAGATLSLEQQGGPVLSLAVTRSTTHPGELGFIMPPGTPLGRYDVVLRDAAACGARLVDAVIASGAAPGVLTLTPGTVSAGAGGSVGLSSTTSLHVTRAYLAPVGSLAAPTPLRTLTSLSPTRYAVTLPTSLSVGDYQVTLVDNVGWSAQTTTPLHVVAGAAPVISAQAPLRVVDNPGQAFTLEGHDFRSPTVSVSCTTAAGAPISMAAPTVDSSSSTMVSGTFDPWTPGVCVLRLTNADGTTVEAAPIEVHGPAQQLGAVRASPSLFWARRAAVALTTEVHGARLHVLSGDDGTVPTDVVETATLDPSGAPLGFIPQRERLGQARTNAAGVAIGRWLYLVGGVAGGAALDTVERAEVLDASAAEALVDAQLAAAPTGLTAGAYSWQVSAVTATGEQVASAPWQVTVPSLSTSRVQVTLRWRGTPGAVTYRVYRGGQRVAELNAPATTFTDVGAGSSSTAWPLPPGATGPWQTLAAHLSVPREGAGVTWAMDPADPTRAYVYVFGGRKDAGHVSDTFEFLPLTLDASGGQQPAAAFTAGAVTLGAPRWLLGASAATSETSSRVGAGQTWLYVLSGLGVTGTAESTCEAGQVLPGGQLSAWTALPALSRWGYGQVVVDDRLLVFGGEATPSVGTSRADLCVSGAPGCSGVSAWATGEPMGTSRTQLGVARWGPFIYAVGGLGTPSAATNSVEFRTW